MAKSTRSKVKRQWRAKKRNDSVYAVTEAARLHRLSQKLKTIVQTDAEGDYEVEDATAEGEGSENREQQTGDDSQPAETNDNTQDAMDLDKEASSSKRISTHGPRGSRRDEWRESKGLPPRARSTRINRQGAPVAKRKGGRSHRRR